MQSEAKEHVRSRPWAVAWGLVLVIGAGVAGTARGQPPPAEAPPAEAPPADSSPADSSPAEPAAAVTVQDADRTADEPLDDRAVLPPPPVGMPAPFVRPRRVIADGRERWTLMRRPLTNRQLKRQLTGRPWRIGRDLGLASAAADTTVGTQQSPWVSEKTRFHGWFIADTFLAVRPLAFVDVNLNLLILNPSASDAYRGSAEILPGFSTHLHGTLARPGGRAMRGDLVIHDLGRVTLGEGLLVEEIPLEGVLGSLRWRGLEARVTTGGRVFWSEDDLVATELSALDRRLGLQVTVWPTRWPVFPSDDGDAEPIGYDYANTTYVGLFGEVQPLPTVRVAGEAAARVDRGGFETAALLRADWMDWSVGPLALHLGWQVRWYQQGFGPVDRPAIPSTLPNHLWREDAYFTNAFEYLQASPNYHQWSHTLMAEVRSRLVGPLWITVDFEAWVRFVADPAADDQVRYLPDGTRLPAVVPTFAYRGGLQLVPWADQAVRASLLVSNRLVNTARSVRTPVVDRFLERPQLVFELEVDL